MENEQLILNQLLELNAKVGGIQADIHTAKSELKQHQDAEVLVLQEIKDHVSATNGRVTELEKSKWKVTGIVGFITFIITAIGAFFGIHH
jgi:exonuclease III